MTYQNINALIIEDNATDTDVLLSLFDYLGVQYHVVYDSRQIADTLEAIPVPDVIFLDLEIPGTTGYEVLLLIQSYPEFQDVPVVAYTSHAAEMAAARNAGFHSFLGKPLRSSIFADQFERIINGEPVWEVR